jgi:hypothetical protein
MALFGKGMLVVFNEVKKRDEADFNEWYNREHIDERINLPGFRRARRYVAVNAKPKFLATYECSKVGDLATPGYLALLANQTAWSQRVMNNFTFFKRMTLRVQVDLTHGVGGALTAVRFAPHPSARAALTSWLKEDLLPQAIALPGMVGAAAAENDLDISNAPGKGKNFDYPRTDEAEWIVMLESGEPANGEAAAKKLFKLSSLKKFGVSKAPIIGSYRLLFGHSR